MKIVQAESADSVSNILLNIYYETAQAESADSVSNILLNIYYETAQAESADSVSNILEQTLFLKYKSSLSSNFHTRHIILKNGYIC